jgi:hypothetical protein
MIRIDISCLDLVETIFGRSPEATTVKVVLLSFRVRRLPERESNLPSHVSVLNEIQHNWCCVPYFPDSLVVEISTD